MGALVAIVGPTGVGKSRLGVYLSKLFGGEIINADSLQVYRLLNIGTAKPKTAEFEKIPHHLFDIIYPNETLTVAEYQKLAFQKIDEIHGRNRLPVLIGGSGQYIWSVIEGWQFPHVEPDIELRKMLELKAGKSIDTLYEELRQIDPDAAGKIHPRNVRRVIRALEVNYKTNRRFSELGEKITPPFRAVIIGLTLLRTELYNRLDLRAEDMFKLGFIDEVKALLKLGYHGDLPAMKSIGYKQVVSYLRGELSIEEAKSQMKNETHRLVRHQYAWFKSNDKRIHWFDIININDDKIADFVRTSLSGDDI